MSAHVSKTLTDAQRHMLKMSTLGSAKVSAGRRFQIVTPRASNQRFQRPEVTCITCGELREPRAYPVCPNCVGSAA